MEFTGCSHGSGDEESAPLFKVILVFQNILKDAALVVFQAIANTVPYNVAAMHLWLPLLNRYGEKFLESNLKMQPMKKLITLWN